MMDYIYKSELDKLKEELFEKTGRKTQKELAAYLGLTETLVSRIFSNKERPKTGFEIKSIEKIVAVFSKNSDEEEQEARERVYRIVYNPDIVKKKLEDYEKYYRLKTSKEEKKEEKKDVVNTENVKKEEREINREDVNVANEKKQKNDLEKVHEAIEQILKTTSYDIKNYDKTKAFDTSVLYKVNNRDWEGALEVFKPPYIEDIYGIWLTEENYSNVMARIETLGKNKSGIIILCSESIEIYMKVKDDEKVNINNNVLVYLDEYSQLYVKSVRKKGKSLLKNVFGEESLMFP